MRYIAVCLYYFAAHFADRGLERDIYFHHVHEHKMVLGSLVKVLLNRTWPSSITLPLTVKHLES